MNFEQEFNQLKDTLVVMAEIQRRQAEVQRMQAENMAKMEQRQAEEERSMALHKERMAHIELTLSEITDKLNGLIGFMDGYFRKQ